MEYLDVAEQCMQALLKISREQPLACLQSGAIMAMLNFIYFFSTSVQRVALSGVVNICKKLSSDSSIHFMEAVPILCNLLQYEDRQLVESATTCLIKIGEQVHGSSDMLDEICIPNFAEVNSFIASVFDPDGKNHVQKLKEMDPISFETVLLLMRNLTINLSSPDFDPIIKVLSSYEISTKAVVASPGTAISAE